jgi:hypothetical protein
LWLKVSTNSYKKRLKRGPLVILTHNIHARGTSKPKRFYSFCGPAPLKHQASPPLKPSSFPEPLRVFHRNSVHDLGSQRSSLIPRKLWPLPLHHRRSGSIAYVRRSTLTACIAVSAGNLAVKLALLLILGDIGEFGHVGSIGEQTQNIKKGGALLGS